MNTGGLIIWLLSCGLCTAAFAAISLWATKRKTPMHFFSGEEIPAEKVSDIPAWNAACAKMWGVYAAAFGVTTLLGFVSMPAAVVMLVLCCTVGVGALLAVNARIRKKYWVK